MPDDNLDAERSLRARLAAHESWANTPDRAARTAKARTALEAKWLEMADGDPDRAEHYRKAHYLRMALKSHVARRKAAGLLAEAAEAEARLAELDAQEESA